MNSVTPSIRFKNHNGSWKRIELKEVADIFGGNAWKSSDYLQDGKYLVVTIANVSGDTYINDSIGNHINCDNPNNFLLKKDDLLISLTGNVGRVSKMTSVDGVLNQRVGKILPFDTDKDFLFHIVHNPLFEKAMIEAGQGAAQKNISNKDVLSYSFLITTDKGEQEKIGRLLNSVDSLLDLYSERRERMLIVKKSLINQMFVCCEDNIPHIRFMGFSDQWSKKDLDATFSFLQNNTLSRADLNDDAGCAKNVHYGDVLVKFEETIDLESEALPYIQSEEIAAKYDKSFLVNGDVVIADTAEDELVGKCSELINCSNLPIISGLHTIPIRPKQKFANGYLGFYFNSNAYHDQLLPLMQGIKVYSLSKTAIKNTFVSFPNNILEQEKIGNMFIKINKLLKLYEQKIDLLKKVKTSLVNKLLPN